MRLWIALHLPRLPLEVFTPSWSTDAGTDVGTVVLEHERVLVASQHALDAGVRTGMRRGGVLMLLPDARIHARTPAQEADARHAVALALLQYTPQVAQAEESTLLMDVGASLRLFGGILALCRRIHANVRALGFTASLACAPTARGACRLPRPGLQRRCGRDLLDLLDAAYGLVPELHEWIAPPETFRARLELYDRIDDADLLLAGAQCLLLQLTGWLCARQLAVERILLRLEHERGRVARAPTGVEIVLAEPTWRDEHLVRLLRERLGRLVLDAPVIGLALEALQVRPMAPPNASLFPEPGGSEEDRMRMLELLAARLGPENVLQPLPLADYRPDQANVWVPVQQKVSDKARNAQLPPDVLSLPRPTWLLAKPIALLMREHRPFYGSSLRMASNPERIEAGWWDGPETRDYFIAEGQDHTLYWVYRERIGSGDDGPKWFLHGLFG
ncbi:MAG: DNA polymerase Y family protein [Massilia sp.]|nr:DNA polymerase Y family protein [Massilia sp.]